MTRSVEWLEKGIMVMDNALPDLEGFRQMLTRVTWTPGRVYSTRDNTNARICDDFGLSGAAKTDPSFQPFDHQLLLTWQEGLSRYHERHRYMHVKADEGYTIVRYQKGGKYEEHADADPHNTRAMSGLIYLNDDYEGGELDFTGLSIRYKPRANQLILFPSNFLYPHAALPVLAGTKYTVVTWFS